MRFRATTIGFSVMPLRFEIVCPIPRVASITANIIRRLIGGTRATPLLVTSGLLFPLADLERPLSIQALTPSS